MKDEPGFYCVWESPGHHLRIIKRVWEDDAPDSYGITISVGGNWRPVSWDDLSDSDLIVAILPDLKRGSGDRGLPLWLGTSSQISQEDES